MRSPSRRSRRPRSRRLPEMTASRRESTIFALAAGVIVLHIADA
jgi:hypothetical protein